MRVAVIGAGAIGAVVAGAVGNEVVVGVRTPIRSLELLSGDRSTTVPAQLLTSPDLVPWQADVVFLTVKATDTESAAPWLLALCSASTLVVAVQNGLDHAARVAPYAPTGVEVVPGLAYIAAERLAAGQVRHLSGSLLIVPSGVSARVAAAVPGLEVEGTDDMVTATWLKLLGNLVANPITALTMRRIDVLREPPVTELARGVLREAVLVGRASGASMSDSDAEAVLTGALRYGAETGSSMLYDRMAGRPLEHQYLTGEVVRRAEPFGIDVPLNSTLLALLEAVDREPS